MSGDIWNIAKTKKTINDEKRNGITFTSNFLGIFSIMYRETNTKNMVKPAIMLSGVILSVILKTSLIVGKRTIADINIEIKITIMLFFMFFN